MQKMFFDKLKFKKIDILSLLLILFFFAIDRVSKIFVINLIQSTGKEIYLTDYLNITLNWNTGIAFGLLSFNTSTIYHLISALILLLIVYLIYLMVLSDNFGKIIFSLIIGGAIGNLYDRLTFFSVPDFIDFHINGYHWYTFNVSDIFISVGIFIMVIRELFLKKKNV